MLIGFCGYFSKQLTNVNIQYKLFYNIHFIQYKTFTFVTKITSKISLKIKDQMYISLLYKKTNTISYGVYCKVENFVSDQ